VGKPNRWTAFGLPEIHGLRKVEAKGQAMSAQISITDYLPILPQGTPPEVVAGIRDAALRAYHGHGAAAFEASIETAIAHEVGHGIVGAAEGFGIRSLAVFPRTAPGLGQVWGGRCVEAAATWTTGPDTSAEDDLRRARFIIAGLAGEAITGHDKPGSSLDELALSQFVGINAAVKLRDLTLSDEAYSAYVKQLWHEQVWGVAVSVLRANWEPFNQLAGYLHRDKYVHGRTLDKVLAQVKRRQS
jgi:hypothetical protein